MQLVQSGQIELPWNYHQKMMQAFPPLLAGASYSELNNLAINDDLEESDSDIESED
jgi:hypothetical protein